MVNGFCQIPFIFAMVSLPTFTWAPLCSDGIRIRHHLICCRHWVTKIIFRNMAPLISKTSGYNSMTQKHQCINSLIDCLSTSPWPLHTIFPIHNVCSWPFFSSTFFSSGLKKLYLSSAVCFHFISCKNPSSTAGTDLRLGVKGTNYYSIFQE